MCGIAGYVGDRESADVLVDALSKLEDGLRMENHQTLIHIHMAIRELLLYITV